MKCSHLHLLSLSLLLLFAVGCGRSDDVENMEHSPADHGDGAKAPAASLSGDDAVSTADGVTTVEMTGNDQMKYNVTGFSVQSGDTVRLIFQNVGKMPRAAMGHNVVFLIEGADVNAFVTAAANARDNDYLPADLMDQVLAHTKLLGPGQSDTIEFTAPEPGEYTFLCSFPAHTYAGMRGVMQVE